MSYVCTDKDPQRLKNQNQNKNTKPKKTKKCQNVKTIEQINNLTRQDMADSIDRVFSKAVTTIKTLSTRSGYGSLPRPPLETRIKLYGLYKQATEGNISVELLDKTDINSIEDEIILKKYDSWYSNLNLSITEAKKKYIEILINTMKIYASGTVESRELLNELEYLYDQIKHLPEDDTEDNIRSPELLYNPQFLYPADKRNASQSTNNLLDMRSIYDKNDSIYSFHNSTNNNNNNNSNEINTAWKTEITSILNKIIKDLNFFKKLERQKRQFDNDDKRFKFFKLVLKLLGYTTFNIIILVLLLKINKKRQFINKLI